jgi:hypothetical protein
MVPMFRRYCWAISGWVKRHPSSRRFSWHISRKPGARSPRLPHNPSPHRICASGCGSPARVASVNSPDQMARRRPDTEYAGPAIKLENRRSSVSRHSPAGLRPPHSSTQTGWKEPKGPVGAVEPVVERQCAAAGGGTLRCTHVNDKVHIAPVNAEISVEVQTTASVFRRRLPPPCASGPHQVGEPWCSAIGRFASLASTAIGMSFRPGCGY